MENFLFIVDSINCEKIIITMNNIIFNNKYKISIYHYNNFIKFNNFNSTLFFLDD